MNGSSSRRRSPVIYFVLVFVLSLPFWLLGSVWEPKIAINLPSSALMFVCPLLAASILVYGEAGWSGVTRLWKRGVDFRRIREKRWYLPLVFLMPLLMLVEYAWLKRMGIPVPPFQVSAWLPLLIAGFLFAGICEEIGWSGYAVDPLQERWNALAASLLIGDVWGIWHGIPYLQAHNPSVWVVWQIVVSISNRVLIVWLYNNTGNSVFAASLFHAMYNVSFLVLLPVYGSYYNPIITCLLITVTAAMVIFLWSPKTLARYRYA